MLKILIRLENGQYLKDTSFVFETSGKGVNLDQATLFNDPERIEYLLGKLIMPNCELVYIDVPDIGTVVKSKVEKYELYTELERRKEDQLQVEKEEKQ